MTVTDVNLDLDAHTLTLVAEYRAPRELVWQLWSNPRLLERWWGPPTYPATFTRHEFVPGGIMEYHMTGPDGDTPPGWWRVLEVEESSLFVFVDGFGAPESVSDLPSGTTRVTLTEIGDGVTRMTLVGANDSRETLQQLVDMGIVEGLTGALGQTDAILEELASGAAS